MANRLLLGKRNGTEYGFYISKPGYNVLTVSDDYMLFTSNRKMFQLISKGGVLFTGFDQVQQIWVPNIGKAPLIFTGASNYAIEAQVVNNNTINLISRYQSYSASGGSGGTSGGTQWCTYFVTNQVFF